MSSKYPLISEKCPHILHGGDYNPEQWLKTPGILDEDIRMMRLAHCNVMTVGIFSWDMLEPDEGRFEFDWLDRIMERLAENGIFVILATPSGSKPAWMSEKYPEVLRTGPDRVRFLHGQRHNHCLTSPIYRGKTAIINRKLAERYKGHRALLMWHVSNEYGGECHCVLCQEAFRNWLKVKYDNNIEMLNDAWWTTFWSHRFTDWSQIESPSPHGENQIHGLNLDWKRFVTDQTIDFYKNEIVPLRELTPNIKITTNFMETFEGLDYWKFAKELDVVSWDCYPDWHSDQQKDWELASNFSFIHDINRCLKGGRPFMLMESTPSLVSWHPVNKPKRPGMHLLSSVQAVAHGSDTIQYFQWRKGRGGIEKFHGAVVDHCGRENTRVFHEVAQTGEVITGLDRVLGSTVRPDVAVIFDWENRWAIEDARALYIAKTGYLKTCQDHYRTFWKHGVPVDVINMDCDFSGYRLLVAPMLYMVRPGVAERIEAFVKNGGTFVATYWSGIVNESDLCWIGGFPGPLRRVTGIWSEEMDSLYDSQKNGILFSENNRLGMNGEYEAHTFCDVIHAETAEVLATYTSDYYRGMPALTVNSFGDGHSYYMAARQNADFYEDFYRRLIDILKLKRALDAELPEGVTAQLRTDGTADFVFLMNFREDEKQVSLGSTEYEDMLTGKMVGGDITLGRYGVAILTR